MELANSSNIYRDFETNQRKKSPLPVGLTEGLDSTRLR